MSDIRMKQMFPSVNQTLFVPIRNQLDTPSKRVR